MGSTVRWVDGAHNQFTMTYTLLGYCIERINQWILISTLFDLEHVGRNTHSRTEFRWVKCVTCLKSKLTIFAAWRVYKGKGGKHGTPYFVILKMSAILIHLLHESTQLSKLRLLFLVLLSLSRHIPGQHFDQATTTSKFITHPSIFSLHTIYCG
jgi:hypothetical protein